MSAQQEFMDAKNEMAAGLLERDEEVHLCLVALVAEEHALFVGSPGTAKSLLVETIAHWTGLPFFSLLVNKFTTPEEVFGPLNIQELKAGKYTRVTQGRLPEAGVAFLDEIFKASSAILNTTLKILNERRFDNGKGDQSVPLQMCLAASNEWPGSDGGGQELAAVFDRFLIRRNVEQVKKPHNIERLMWDSNLDPTPKKQLSAASLNQARAEVRQMAWAPESREAFRTIRRDLAREGIKAGDRRLRKSVKACQATAWMEGASEVRVEDLSVLSHILWSDPLEQPKKAAEVVERIANPGKPEMLAMLGEAEEIMASVVPDDISTLVKASKQLKEIDKKMAALGKVAAEGKKIIGEHIASLLKRGQAAM